MALAAQVDEGPASHVGVRAAPPAFADVYQQTFAFVWRTARRLGVMDSAVDDVVQEVFVTVYRRLDQFEGRCSVKTWVFSILMGIVRNYRRSRRRKGAAEPISAPVVDPDLLEDRAADPLEQASRAQAGRMVQNFRDEMTEDKRSCSYWRN